MALNVWTRLPEMPEARAGAAAVPIGSGIAFLGGGVDANLLGPVDGQFFEPAMGWRTIPEAPLEARALPAAVVVDGDPVVWGGLLSDGTRARDGALFDVAEARWRRLPIAPIGGRGGVWTGTHLVGFDIDSTDTRTVVSAAKFDPVDQAWTLFDPLELQGGHDPAWVWTGSELIVLVYGVGGAGHAAAALDPGTGSWRALPAPPLDPIESPRGVWTGDEALFLGGGPGRSNAAYSPGRDEWRRLPPPTTSGFVADQPVWTGQIAYLHGPHPVAFDPAIPAWLTLPGPPPDTSTSGYSIVWTGSSILVSGGLRAAEDRAIGVAVELRP